MLVPGIHVKVGNRFPTLALFAFQDNIRIGEDDRPEKKPFAC